MGFFGGFLCGFFFAKYKVVCHCQELISQIMASWDCVSCWGNAAPWVLCNNPGKQHPSLAKSYPGQDIAISILYGCMNF